jgi:hypothetical protein
MLKQIKILFFIKGVLPTIGDQLMATQYGGAQVCFRNAMYVDGASEPCDGVAGCVPECYAKFPTAEQALAKRETELKAAQAKLGEQKAPKATTRASAPTGNQGQPANPNPPQTNPQTTGKPLAPQAWNPNPPQ